MKKFKIAALVMAVATAFFSPAAEQQNVEADALPSANIGDEVKIGSDYFIGRTTPGSTIVRRFRIANKYSDKKVIIAGFGVESSHHVDPWVVFAPPPEIPAAESVDFEVRFSPDAPGTYRLGLYWFADTDPPSEKDPFFTFDVTAEAAPKDETPSSENPTTRHETRLKNFWTPPNSAPHRVADASAGR